MFKTINTIFSKIIFPLIFILAGVIFTVLSVSNLSDISSFPKTNAEITDIVLVEEAATSDDTDDYDVYVEYFFQGQNYNSTLDSYSSSYDIGDKIEVAVNPDDPYDIRSTGFMSKLAPFVGVIFALAGVYLLLRGLIFRR